MSRERSLPVVFAITLALGGCRSTQPTVREERARPTIATPAIQEEPVLYARDGSVVPISPTGGRQHTIERTDAPIHGLQPREESRMQLLDLYQKVVDEKESLAQEVRALDTVLAETRSAQAAAEKEREELRVRIGGLEERLRQIEEERADLAARLTTAQIRRLEAEKLLLEFRLAVARPEKGESPRKDTDARRVREAASDKAATSQTGSRPAAVPAPEDGAQAPSTVNPKGHP